MSFFLVFAVKVLIYNWTQILQIVIAGKLIEISLTLDTVTETGYCIYVKNDCKQSL